MCSRKIEFSPPDIGEEEIQAVSETLRSGWITTGPKTKLFEKKIAEFCETSRAVCLNSATAGLELTLRLFGIGEGDEVITTAYTYTATASVIYHVGAKIVLVDTQKDSYEMDYEKLEQLVTEKTKAIIPVDYTATASVIYHVGAKIVLVDTQKDSYEMDYEKLEQLVTEKTKAIIPVDLAGVICDYEKIYQIVEAKKALFKPRGMLQERLGRILVLADAAHALGAVQKGKHCGQVADFTSFSFHAVKNLTTAEGGAVTWKENPDLDDEYIYQQYMLMSLHGQSKDALSKTQLGAWEYDIIAPLFKCNMTDIMASIGLVQLSRYDELLSKRQRIIETYNVAFSELPIEYLKHSGKDYQSSGHLYMIRIKGKERKECNAIIQKLAEMGVAANVHYKPLPLLSAYKNLGFQIENFPNAYQMYQNEITLPLHTLLMDEDVEYIINKVKLCIR